MPEVLEDQLSVEEALRKRGLSATKGMERAVTINEIDDTLREVTFVASDEGVDRHGDIIRVAGWDLKDFKKNPIMLWQHRSDEPIGTVSDIWREGTTLMATAKFLAEGITQRADFVWALIKARVLRAVSVGFSATKPPSLIKDEKTGDWTGGLEWNGTALHELSVVSVPANASALVLSRKMNIPEEFIAEAFTAGEDLRKRDLELLQLRNFIARYGR